MISSAPRSFRGLPILRPPKCGVAVSRLLIEAADPALTTVITAKTAKNPMNLLD
jgi:hypothetical protein